MVIRNSLNRDSPFGILPQTGQTGSYDANGDDGDYQAGHPVAGSDRFIDGTGTELGTVRDLATGLMWVKQPSLIIPASYGQVQTDRETWSPSTDNYIIGDLVVSSGVLYVCIKNLGGTSALAPASDATHWVPTPWVGDVTAANRNYPAQFTWANAITVCEALDYCGYTDWRLPNVLEMESLLDFGVTSITLFTAFPEAPCDAIDYGSQVNYDWTSTSVGANTDQAIAVRLTHSYYMMTVPAKTTDGYVYPVRGGVINA